MSGTMSGAKIAPMFEPVLKIPVATERSFGGNHSVTTRMAAGKFPDSPSPSANRAPQKPPTVRHSACNIADKLQNKTDRAYALLMPIKFINEPKPNCPMA
jgi:hypothetical protein